MYILTRYVVWEVLKYFLAALVALTLIFTLGMGKRAGDEWHLPFTLVFRIMPYILPEVLGITIPVAMLYAVSSVFGRMTGSNEVVALKSLGISPMAVVWPVLVLAAFFSLGTVWMYEIAATRCRPAIDRIAGESVEEIVYGMLQRPNPATAASSPSPSSGSRAGNSSARRSRSRAQPGQPEVLISAAEAELQTDWKAHLLRIICRDGEVDIGRGNAVLSFPGEQEWPVPIAEPISPRYHRDRVATRRHPRADRRASRPTGPAPGRTAATRTASGGQQGPGRAGIARGRRQDRRQDRQIADDNELILRLRTEPYRRWSNGFTCLCFALIGMPVAMLWRHADVLTNFFVCFLPILAVYYPLLMFGDKLSTSGALPPVSFWMGNVVLAVPAILLLRWIMRH